jgi:chromosome partitioning protein
MTNGFNVNKVLKLYGSSINRISLIQAEKNGLIPSPGRSQTGTIQRRMWKTDELPLIGERYGFLKKPTTKRCISIFSMPGGVYKTSLALNISRLAALHNIRTCVVGLDPQGSISNALKRADARTQCEQIEATFAQLQQPDGLLALFNGQMKIEELIEPTDLSTLSIIRESPRLAMLDRKLNDETKRPNWLEEQVINPLKETFDLVILDCPSQWNSLVENSIVACDALISPIECSTYQLSALNVFQNLVDDTRSQRKLNFKHIFVPTRFMSTRDQCSEIKSWYFRNLENVTLSVIRESNEGKRAMEARLSVPENSPTSLIADEMRELVKEIWSKLFEFDNLQSVLASSLIQKEKQGFPAKL